MLQLLRIELSKIVHYRAFQVLFGLYLLSLVAIPYLAENFKFLENLQAVFEFPLIWFFYYFMAMLVNFGLSIIVITLTCNEYSFRTARQQVIDGLTREQLVGAKVLLIVLFSLIATLVFLLNGFVAGSVNSFEFKMDQALDRADFTFGFFMHALMIMSMCYFIATLLRRTGLAIFILLAWFMVLENIIKFLVLPEPVRKYMPASVLYHIGEINTALLLNPPEGPDPVNLLLKGGYTVLFLGLSYLLVRRRDL